MIDIIIDCLNTVDEQIKRTLGSICYQLNMPKVYVHINGDISKNLLNHYENFIRIDSNINNINGNYLMYINAGDVLASPYALEKLYRYNQYDVVVSNCIRRDKEGIQYNVFDDTENFYVKLYRRAFVDNKKIDYTNKFVLNKLCMMNAPNIYFLEYKTYLMEEKEKNVEEYINNIKQTISYGLDLKLYNGVFQLATEVLVDMYHEYLNDRLKIDIKELRNLAIIYNQYKTSYRAFIKMSKYQFTIKDVIPEISFNEFIKKVMRR